MAVLVGNIVIYCQSSSAGSRSGSHDPELSSLRTVSTAPGGWDLGGENFRSSLENPLVYSYGIFNSYVRHVWRVYYVDMMVRHCFCSYLYIYIYISSTIKLVI